MPQVHAGSLHAATKRYLVHVFSDPLHPSQQIFSRFGKGYCRTKYIVDKVSCSMTAPEVRLELFVQ